VLRKRAVPPLRALIEESARADNVQACFAACRQAMILYPYRFTAYHYSMAQALRWGMPAEQSKIWPRAVERLPNEHETRLYLWLHEAQSGRLNKGFQMREAMMSQAPWQRRTKVQPPEDIPSWTGQPLTGKSIVIWSEFGLGDEVFFFRFARILREQCGAAHVAIVCQAPLLELFKDSGEVDAAVDIDHVADLPPQDYWVYPHAIPAWVPLDYEALPHCVPYLRAPNPRTYPCPPETLKVGIVFKGNPTMENEPFRSLPSLSTLDSVFELPGIQFYSLQKGEGTEQAAQYAQERGNFTDLGSELHNMAQTANIIAGLDLVLTTDTSVAHVAGALGKPVWVMLAFVCDWRYHYLREDNPWYPAMRVFRKSWGNWRDWSSVIARVRNELAVLRQAHLDKLAD
jgi:hypothetical protein